MEVSNETKAWITEMSREIANRMVMDAISSAETDEQMVNQVLIVRRVAFHLLALDLNNAERQGGKTPEETSEMLSRWNKAILSELDWLREQEVVKVHAGGEVEDVEPGEFQ